jgi:uncharacterized protein (DUF488 family)
VAADRTKLPRIIYSVGYDGLTLEQFLRRLDINDVTTVVDVRMTAASRKPGFSKRKLQSALCGVGIAYVHESREAGDESDSKQCPDDVLQLADAGKPRGVRADIHGL